MRQGLSITIEKNMPLKSGLGSSAASSVAALYAFNSMLSHPLSKEELLPFALESEKAMVGDAHGDNVTPCMLGGLTLITGYQPFTFKSLPPWEGLHFAVIRPDIEVSTKEAREILPLDIKRSSWVMQSAYLSHFITSWYDQDLQGLKCSMKDIIITPYRKKLIPYFDEFEKIAIEEDIVSFGLSGSGPSLFMVDHNSNKLEKTGERIKSLYKKNSIDSDFYLSEINYDGACIV